MLLRFVSASDSTPEPGQYYWIRFDELSEGQRALTVLYGLLHLTHGGWGVCLLLDEPDNYVAPREIMPWLLALSQMCEDTPSQAILCSHHPEVINYLGPTQTQILSRNASGAATARGLDPGSAGSSIRLAELMARGLGALSKAVRVVLLCEDKQHEVFLRRFLIRDGWHLRDLTPVIAPSAQGSAEQFVRNQFPQELAKLRYKRGERKYLVVMTDGDSIGVEKRKASLMAACTEQGVRPPRRRRQRADLRPNLEHRNMARLPSRKDSRRDPEGL